MPELTPLQRRTLEATAERILPSDDGPGAREAGVADFVAAALGEERHGNPLPLFAYGLDRLDELAREAAGTGFAELPPERRDDVLQRFEALPEPGASHFFTRLVRLCVEGFAGAPGPGWQYLGYPPAGMEDDGCLVPIQGSGTF